MGYMNFSGFQTADKSIGVQLIFHEAFKNYSCHLTRSFVMTSAILISHKFIVILVILPAVNLQL
jgi:hypothetical protein